MGIVLELAERITMYSTEAWGKISKEANFSKFQIERNLPGDDDVQFEVKYCGICHTDVHFAEKTSAITKYPLVPGHELAGVVTKVGAKVKDIKVGDNVGVGVLSDSCQKCGQCDDGEEQACEKIASHTYNYDTVHGHIKTGSGFTQGGYCRSMTAHRRYLVKVPVGYPLQKAGPILCAGITMYSPLSHWGCLKGGKRVGIVGIGGLGQMGVRLAKAMGNTVTAISTSPHKETVAREIGADNFVLSNKPESMAAAAKSLDLILNTVSADHDLTALIGLLARDGTIVQLGLVLGAHQVVQMPLMFNKLSIAGSLIGGIPETQECIDFCAKHKIVPITKVVKASDLGQVYKQLSEKNDTIIRNVLDIEASKTS